MKSTKETVTSGTLPLAIVPEAPWAVPVDALLEDLAVDVGRGLDEAEVLVRRAEYGPNELQRRQRRGAFGIFVAQFRSLIVVLLGSAALVAFLFGEILEAWSILVVIAINAGLGFVTELRAVRSMEALYALGRVTARVRRTGHVGEVHAEELVPGDLVVLTAGDIISADLRIVDGSRLQADESALTGESLPVSKGTDPVSLSAPLAERTSMLFKGTSLTRGSGAGVVTATGARTEIGHITALVEKARRRQTPLERRLDLLGRRLIWVALTLAALVTGLGLARGKDLYLMLETGIALSVASIPEGLPIVATIALARGVYLMAKRNALINRLSSVETLGSAGVICTDKTGTLTENRLAVVRLVSPAGDLSDLKAAADDDHGRRALEVGMLCSNASEHGGHVTGDPLETALLKAGLEAGIDHGEILERFPEVREEAFDSGSKMMATFHHAASGFRVAVKGAPERVIEACTEFDRKQWQHQNESLAKEGFRVLGVAEKYVDRDDALPYEDLTFLALVALADPPRSGVRESVETCRRAGIQVVMVTGDQPETALSIARQVGIVDDVGADVVYGPDLKSLNELDERERQRLREVAVYARMSPAQKLDLIELHQNAGHVVAMTGDGVNDAPALKKADIGIAMGRRGTQVAREAADMVLRDDSFSSIVAAIEQGRVIFGNIRRFVFYLLSCNVSEVMVVGIATAFGGMLPVLPLQILSLNLVTDIFPALALGMGAGEPGVMNHPPRRTDGDILKRRHWRAILLYGGLITAVVLTALILSVDILHLPSRRAVTISFVTLALAQIWHVFNMRARGSSFLKNEITRNPHVWAAVAVCLLLVILAVNVPALADVLRIERLGPKEWMLVLALSLVPFVVGQIGLTRRLIRVGNPPTRRRVNRAHRGAEISDVDGSSKHVS